MTNLDLINRIIVSLGLPTIFASLIYIGRKLNSLDSLERAVNKELRPELKNLTARVSFMEGRFNTYVQSQSPVSLTEKGERMLVGTGLKEYIDSHQQEITQDFLEHYKPETPYDIQQTAYQYFGDEFHLPEDKENKVKDYVYNDGSNVEVAMRVAALYFRDLYLGENKKEPASAHVGSQGFGHLDR